MKVGEERLDHIVQDFFLYSGCVGSGFATNWGLNCVYALDLDVVQPVVSLLCSKIVETTALLILKSRLVRCNKMT
jgi:hypothetical protein